MHIQEHRDQVTVGGIQLIIWDMFFGAKHETFKYTFISHHENACKMCVEIRVKFKISVLKMRLKSKPEAAGFPACTSLSMISTVLSTTALAAFMFSRVFRFSSKITKLKKLESYGLLRSLNYNYFGLVSD